MSLLLFLTVASLNAREKEKIDYGAGLIVNVPLPEAEVERAVDEVVKNGIIRGTKEYNKDEYIQGAIAATSSRVFPAWTEGGKVFYKVRANTVDPRNFKDGADVGMLAVRYVVQEQGDKNTVLRIDAIFVEDFRHTVHPSNGSVESSEYKDIHDHLDSTELMNKETAEAEKAHQEQVARKQQVAMNTVPSEPTVSTPGSEPVDAPPGAATVPAPAPMPDLGPSLEQRVQDLRRQVECRVKSPGAPLKSAPFHTAGTLQSLPPGTEVMIVVSTPYWYGVETHDGQHGWILRDDLEQMP